MESPHPPFYEYVPVSKLAKYAVCPKRAKIELFKNPRFCPAKPWDNPLIKGSKMHERKCVPFRNWGKKVFLANLEHAYGKVYQRIFRNYAIRCIPDDYIVQNREVQVMELFTTQRSRLSYGELAVKRLQLQLELWVLEPLLSPISFKLADTHILQVFSQQTEKKLLEAQVKPFEDMPKFLAYVFDSFMGLERMKVPPYYVCKRCSPAIKELCDWRVS